MTFRRRALPFVIAILALAAILVVVRRPILRSAGWALVAEDAIEPADVIVVPEWAHDAGALEVADLVGKGIAMRVAVLLDPPQPAQLELIRRGVLRTGEGGMIELLKKLGVTSIEAIPSPATGTEDEGRVLFDWSTQKHFRRIVVISTSDHSHRLRRVLGRSMKGAAAEVVVRSARYSSFDPDTWWKTRGGIRTEIIETEKLLLDLVRHPIS